MVSLARMKILTELNQVRNREKRQLSSSPTMRLLPGDQAHTAVNGQQEKSMQEYKYSSKPTANYMTSRSTCTAQLQETGLVGGSPSSRVEGPYTKTVVTT